MGQGAMSLPTPTKPRMAELKEPGSGTVGDKLHGRAGEQPRPPAKVPECGLSGKGGGAAKTAGMLAQKQPSFKECVIAHRSSGSAPKTQRG